MKNVTSMIVTGTALLCLLCAALNARAETIETTIDYPDVTVTAEDATDADHFLQVWDLSAGDMVISFTYDAAGMVDDLGGSAHAWSEFGVRQVGYGDFNPTWMIEGAGVWLATDYEWSAYTFDPDPVGSPSLDMDDKLILQKGGGQGESDYNLPVSPLPNPWANHAVWFDRDGVDQWQAGMWGTIDGVTYNTEGTYDVVITLHATSPTDADAYMTINGEPQGFYDPGWHSGPADLMPAGMTFSGDMTQMQVFYGMYAYGALHSAEFRNIRVSGQLVLEAGMATGGGWFVPDTFSGISEGGKATFGFVAKQKKGLSSGNLEFKYHADGLELKSESYDWVSVSAVQAMFEGTGILNEEPGYRFRVRAVDGDKTGTEEDRFEIRIWTGTDTYDMPTYRAEGNLDGENGGGQIVVHKR
jgi:hypothetical protein